MQDIACKNCSTIFQVTPDDLAFYEKISPTLHGKVHVIPPSVLCPECRLKRKLTFRNERSLYRRTCGKCQKSMVSLYSTDKPYNAYCRDCWWGDAWSPLDYGRDFDFTKTFAENFDALWKEVPIIGLWNMKDQNAEYNNGCFELKDSYMNFNSDWGENYLYNYITEFSKDMTDCAYAQKSELCYECVDIMSTYHCLYSQDMENCQDCYFSSDLIGCRKCFGCHGLRHKEGYIYNKKVSDQEWNDFMTSLRLTRKNIKIYKEESNKIRITVPKKALHKTQCENSTGDYLYRCKNSTNCFDLTSGEDDKNLTYGVGKTYKVRDTYATGNSEWAYEFMGGGASVSNVAFSISLAENVTDVYYSVFCMNNAHNLFGCSGIRQNQYCILNKQYSKEAYETLLEKIIEHMKKTGEWGTTFPPEISPFGYNETLGQEYFTLTKEEALKKGYKWSEYKVATPNIDTISSDELPEDIHDITDDILKKTIKCEISEKPFKITKQELEFYRKLKLPLPNHHPDQRYKDRIAQRNPRILYERTCMNCHADIQTTYAPNRPEIVYCEKCYLEAVY